MYLIASSAYSEAYDISLHLKPLRTNLEEVDNCDFTEIQKSLHPLMHIVCLLYGKSKYYNIPVRIIILLQEICNLFIDKVSWHSSLSWLLECSYLG